MEGEGRVRFNQKSKIGSIILELKTTFRRESTMKGNQRPKEKLPMYRVHVHRVGVRDHV